ncbi:hypothetical protein Dda_1074 [Drechslerella dactyloides]|uniref:RBR-type E3 ubiquitin transferase n=1 Tax=Drechslerella dactyloides TaxID=74499 RepID=A0AAD6J6B8_DREDA|nr:hypothetical protein Dda_1074 [Drechslerella dactyloides]
MSAIGLVVGFLIWLLTPASLTRRLNIPNIGFEKAYPNASKHFALFSESLTSLFTLSSRQDGLASLYLSPKRDDDLYVRNAYHRYYDRLPGPSKGLLYCIHILEGILQPLEAFQQTRASPAINAIYKCSLLFQKLSYTLKVTPRLGREGRRRIRRNEPYLRLPWNMEQNPPYTRLQLAEQAFFGSGAAWEPIIFQKPVIELSVNEIRNRIALLGESIGWTPDPGDDIKTSGSTVSFYEETTTTCFFCYDDKPLWQMAVLDCDHVSCMDCVKRNVKMCLRDTSQLPPRCCSAYPYIYTSIAVENSKELEKIARWIASGKNPAPAVNCHQCKKELYYGSVFGDIAFCIPCRQRTCVKCNVRWHEFKRIECRLDSDFGTFMDLAMTKNWSQCYACGQVVEKRDGCVHMQCRCGAQFCYRCGGKWPRCPCTKGDRKPKLMKMKDDSLMCSGELYTVEQKELHESNAIENEARFNDTLDALKLLRMLKIYQISCVREITGLRKVLKNAVSEVVDQRHDPLFLPIPQSSVP